MIIIVASFWNREKRQQLSIRNMHCLSSHYLSTNKLSCRSQSIYFHSFRHPEFWNVRWRSQRYWKATERRHCGATSDSCTELPSCFRETLNQFVWKFIGNHANSTDHIHEKVTEFKESLKLFQIISYDLVRVWV